MLEDKPTVGSLVTSHREKRKLAAASLEYNKKNSTFRKLFPELAERVSTPVSTSANDGNSSGNADSPQEPENPYPKLINALSADDPSRVLMFVAFLLAVAAYLVATSE
jgi:ubiquitin-conjugating enzyme E2 J2